MASDQQKKLSEIKQFKQLIAYLRDEMGWPINSDSEFDELTYEYTTTELGIDDKSAAQIQEIKRLRPLSPKQPWGVFFVKFEPKKLPVVALRRILGQVALKKRASANPADRTMWAQEDLLFISSYGEGDDRQITLAHFSAPNGGHTLPSLKVLGWDSKDTVLHLDAVVRELTEQLSWPADESDVDAWRAKWRAAFTLGHQEVVTTSKALSIRLAQLAQGIRNRITRVLAIETEDGHITKLMKAFQQSLIHNLTPEDFADMYAQTIAYGLLSSRIADPKKKSVDDLAIHMRLSPFLKELMEAFLQVGGRNKHTGLDFDELGVGEVVDLLDRANMEAVIADFGNRNQQEDPVIHFYEMFLESYDKELKVQKGVFYTPYPVVKHIVQSLHEQLQIQFGLEDGLADTSTWGDVVKRWPNLTPPLHESGDGKSTPISLSEPFVQVLDPATGTATFLVETIEIIYRTLKMKWKKLGLTAVQQQSEWNNYVPTHLLPRIFGFELMMAPYAIAHLKISLKLSETGFVSGLSERLNVYLTNTLEGPDRQPPVTGFAALAHEAEAVNRVKMHKRFTVVIGNPPYSYRSSNNSPYILDLVRTYRKGINEKKSHLNDDYIKFIRLAQDLIERTGVGIVSLITNNSYLYGVTQREMRNSLLSTFSTIQVLDLGGDAKFSNTERHDENVFEIQQGVAIATFSRLPGPGPKERLTFARIYGKRAEKYEALISKSRPAITYEALPISTETYFTNAKISSHGPYSSWPSLVELFPTYINGVLTARNRFAVAETRMELEQRIADWKKLDVAQLMQRYEDLGLKDNTSVSLQEAQHFLRNEEPNAADLVVKCLYRPFDHRYVMYDDHLVHRARKKVMNSMRSNNLGIVFNRGIRSATFAHAFLTRNVVLTESISSKDPCFVAPALIRSDSDDGWMGVAIEQQNLSPRATEWSRTVGIGPERTAEEIMLYAYAILNSNIYRSVFQKFLCNDFPKIPLSRSEVVTRKLIECGRQLERIHTRATLLSPDPTIKFFGGSAMVGKVSFDGDRLFINDELSAGFTGVSSDMWNYYVGSYRVCDKMLEPLRGTNFLQNSENLVHSVLRSIRETLNIVVQIDQVMSSNEELLNT